MDKILPFFIILVFSLGLGACDKLSGEPGEADMKTAASRSFLKINEDVRKIADECRGEGSIIVNPIKAMKCTSVCAFDPNGCEKLPTLEMTAFKKLACVEAVGEPGWVCDYQYNVESESDFLMKMFTNVYGTENRAQGRFLKSEDGTWMLVGTK